MVAPDSCVSVNFCIKIECEPGMDDDSIFS